MNATVIPLRRSSVLQLECSSCGASAEAACNCGAAYVPAGVKAAKAVANSPGRSDRSIAAELGIGKDTVRRVRKSTGAHAPVGKRIGKDGKARSLPKLKPPPQSSDPVQETCAECDTPEQHWQRSLSNLAGDAVSMRAFWSREFGKWETFEVPSSLVTLVKQAAAAWTKLAIDLSKKRR